MKRTLKPKIAELLDYRITQEETSSRLYLAMSNWLANHGFKCYSTFKTYSDEEQGHANKAKDFLLSLGITPITPCLEEVDKEFTGLPDIIQKTYDHEVEITRQCEELTKACLDEGDMLTAQLGFYYMNEQIEELDKAQTLVDYITTFGTSPEALLMIDNRIS